MRKNKAETRSGSRWVWIVASAALTASGAAAIYWAVQAGVWSHSPTASSSPPSSKIT
jgi:hypothetical protein